MTVVETLLVFVAIPLAIVVLLALLIFLPGARNRRARYKPGQPWEHAPIWYEPHPEHGPAAGHHDGHAIEAAPTARGAAGPLGGARGTW